MKSIHEWKKLVEQETDADGDLTRLAQFMTQDDDIKSQHPELNPIYGRMQKVIDDALELEKGNPRIALKAIIAAVINRYQERSIRSPMSISKIKSGFGPTDLPTGDEE